VCGYDGSTHADTSASAFADTNAYTTAYTISANAIWFLLCWRRCGLPQLCCERNVRWEPVLPRRLDMPISGQQFLKLSISKGFRLHSFSGALTFTGAITHANTSGPTGAITHPNTCPTGAYQRTLLLGRSRGHLRHRKRLSCRCILQRE
jgi:hypothetical protein